MIRAGGIVLALLALTAAAAPEDLRVLQENFVRLESRGDVVDAERAEAFRWDKKRAKEFLAAQRPDGSWPGVDYGGKARSSWEPAIQHLQNRVLFLARGYRLKRDPKLADAVRRGLGLWLEKGLSCPNWWWNDIGAPQVFALAALMVDETLAPEDRARYARYLSRSDVGTWTGQNRVWLARIMMMRGLLSRDEALVDRAAKEIAGEVRTGGNEGPQPDGAFLQHGRQLQFGNYGASFAVNEARLAAAFKGTKWAFGKEKSDILLNLFDNGFRWILWKGRMDLPALGRQLRPGAARAKAAVVALARREFAETGARPQTAEPVGFRYFPSGAYAVYRTADWMASVKMHTSRILETETWINGENTLGGHLCDGSLFLTATGEEHEDIFPLWKNWNLIPGVTAFRDAPPVRRKNPKKGANAADDIAVSEKDGRAEVAFTLKRDGLEVRKCWTFAPDGVTARGTVKSAIDPKRKIVTCVEHAHAAKNFSVRETPDGVSVTNGRFRYDIAGPKDLIHVAVEDRSGDYAGIYPPAEGKMYKGKVLFITVEQTPGHPSYSYRITYF